MCPLQVTVKSNNEKREAHDMDSSITLSYGSRATSTVVSNIFIDKYMTDARGSDVKVYIYLLRCLQDPPMSISIASIAEALDETEKDIKTALKYWDKQKVLSVHCFRDGKVKSITVHDLDEAEAEEELEEESNITLISAHASSERQVSPKIETKVPEMNEPVMDKKEKPNYSMQMIQSFKDEYPDFDELIDYIENALGKTLTTKDLQTVSFIFEELGLSCDLIRFLYDYCIEKGKKSGSYIEKVAREWHSKNIRTIEEALKDIEEFSNRFAVIKTAFGISRPLLDAELQYAHRWYYEFGFGDELVKEACNRTVLSTSKTDFRYTDRILTSWHDRDVKTLEDVKALDMSSAASGAAYKNKGTLRNTKSVPQLFSQRQYSDADFDMIEKKKLGVQ
jgi:DnaD/phage-associated family protein